MKTKIQSTRPLWRATSWCMRWGADAPGMWRVLCFKSMGIAVSYFDFFSKSMILCVFLIFSASGRQFVFWVFFHKRTHTHTQTSMHLLGVRAVEGWLLRCEKNSRYLEVIQILCVWLDNGDLKCHTPTWVVERTIRYPAIFWLGHRYLRNRCDPMWSLVFF